MNRSEGEYQRVDSFKDSTPWSLPTVSIVKWLDAVVRELLCFEGGRILCEGAWRRNMLWYGTEGTVAVLKYCPKISTHWTSYAIFNLNGLVTNLSTTNKRTTSTLLVSERPQLNVNAVIVAKRRLTSEHLIGLRNHRGRLTMFCVSRYIRHNSYTVPVYCTLSSEGCCPWGVKEVTVVKVLCEPVQLVCGGLCPEYWTWSILAASGKSSSIDNIFTNLFIRTQTSWGSLWWRHYHNIQIVC